MESEVERLRYTRDALLAAWQKGVLDMEEARRRHEVEADALRQVIRRQDAQLTEIWARIEAVRELYQGERLLREVLNA